MTKNYKNLCFKKTCEQSNKDLQANLKTEQKSLALVKNDVFKGQKPVFLVIASKK